MKEEVLNKIRADYQDKISARRDLKRELDKLRANARIRQMHPAVCNFFEALDTYFEKEELYYSLFDTDINLLKQIADQYSNLGGISDTNKIFFYRGSCLLDNSKGYYVQCLRSNNTIDYDLYIDIESLERFRIPHENRKKFEDKNHVIVTSSFPTEKDLELVRTTFFKIAVEQGQDVALKKVLSRK